MLVRHLQFFTFTNILCYVFTIGTAVSDKNYDTEQALFQFEKSSSSIKNERSFADGLQGTLSTVENFASRLYYDENQQIRGNTKTCGLVKKILCCICMCCCHDTSDKTVDDSSLGTISGKDLPIGIQIDGGPDRDDKDSVFKIVRQSSTLSNIYSIREWIESHPYPYFPPTFDDHMIERFFYVCENDVERTKQDIQLFFKNRSEMPEFFTDRDPLADNLQNIMDVVYVLPLPKKTEEGYQVYIIHFADSDVKKFHFMSYAKMYYNLCDVRMKTEKEIPTGDVPIFDITGFTLAHIWKLKSTKKAVRKFLKITQEATAVSLKQIHVIYNSPVLHVALFCMKPFLTEETKQKLIFHKKGTDSIFKYIPRDIVPQELGGNGTPMKEIKKTWKQKIEDNRDWLMTNPWRVDIPPEES